MVILNKSIKERHLYEENVKNVNQKLLNIRQEERMEIAQHLHDNIQHDPRTGGRSACLATRSRGRRGLQGQNAEA